eukprot:6475003-Amphidinium_carterae.1
MAVLTGLILLLFLCLVHHRFESIVEKFVMLGLQRVPMMYKLPLAPIPKHIIFAICDNDTLRPMPKAPMVAAVTHTCT